MAHRAGLELFRWKLTANNVLFPVTVINKKTKGRIIHVRMLSKNDVEAGPAVAKIYQLLDHLRSRETSLYIIRGVF